jgi:hypothetical protein
MTLYTTDVDLVMNASSPWEAAESFAVQLFGVGAYCHALTVRHLPDAPVRTYTAYLGPADAARGGAAGRLISIYESNNK